VSVLAKEGQFEGSGAPESHGISSTGLAKIT
jgi:hypothetical protein